MDKKRRGVITPESNNTELTTKLTDYFLERLVLDLESQRSIDAAVKYRECCQIEGKSVLLSQFEEAFDVLGMFKDVLPEGYWVDKKQVRDELDSYKLNNTILTDKESIILAAAIAHTSNELAEKFKPLLDKYAHILSNPPLQPSSQEIRAFEKASNVFSQLNRLIGITPESVIKAIGREKIEALLHQVTERENRYSTVYGVLLKVSHQKPLTENKKAVFDVMKGITDDEVAIPLFKEALDKNTPLGKIFWAPRSMFDSFDFDLFKPALNRGILAKIDEALNERLGHVRQNNLIAILKPEKAPPSQNKI